jgi:hypothetical protein
MTRKAKRAGGQHSASETDFNLEHGIQKMLRINAPAG